MGEESKFRDYFYSRREEIFEEYKESLKKLQQSNLTLEEQRKAKRKLIEDTTARLLQLNDEITKLEKREQLDWGTR